MVFARTQLLPFDRVQAAWEAFTRRPGYSLDGLPPETARLVQIAWNDGAEAGARIERERMAEGCRT